MAATCATSRRGSVAHFRPLSLFYVLFVANPAPSATSFLHRLLLPTASGLKVALQPSQCLLCFYRDISFGGVDASIQNILNESRILREKR
jgi:hypothetical protein